MAVARRPAALVALDARAERRDRALRVLVGIAGRGVTAPSGRGTARRPASGSSAARRPPLRRRVGRQRITVDVEQHRDVLVVRRDRRRAQQSPLAEHRERFLVRRIRDAARVQQLVRNAPDHRILGRHRHEIRRAMRRDRRDDRRVDAFVERVTRVRVPLVRRRPRAARHQRRHLAHAPRQARRKTNRVAELLRLLADLRRAQQRVERPVARRVRDGARAVDDVVEQRALLLVHLSIVQAAKTIAAKLDVLDRQRLRGGGDAGDAARRPRLDSRASNVSP